MSDMGFDVKAHDKKSNVLFETIDQVDPIIRTAVRLK